MYLMENEREAERLEAKNSYASVREQLNILGLREGMRALDAGSGTGAVARAMADVVGATGEVVALDLSRERLRHGATIAHEGNRKQVQFVQGRLSEAPLGPGSFDLVWSRFVFEYLAEPDAVLLELARLLKPGGKLAVLDLDNNGLIHYPVSQEIELGMKIVMQALADHWDPFAGRKLFSRFRRAGLQQIKVHLFPYHVYAGAAAVGDLENWIQKFATIRKVVVPIFGGEQYDRFVCAYIDLLRDPDTFTYSTLVLVEGMKG